MSNARLLRLAGLLALALISLFGILAFAPDNLVPPILAGLGLTATCFVLLKSWNGSWLLQFFAIHSLVYFTFKGVMLLYAYFFPPNPGTPLFFALTDPILLAPNAFNLFASVLTLQTVGLIFFFLGSKLRLSSISLLPLQEREFRFPWNPLLVIYGLCIVARIATIFSGRAAGFDVQHEYTNPGFTTVALAQVSYLGRLIASGLIGAGFWLLRKRPLDRLTLVSLVGVNELMWSILSGSRQHIVIVMILSLYALYAFGPRKEFGRLKQTTLRIGLLCCIGVIAIGIYRWAYISSGANGSTALIQVFSTIGRVLVSDPLEPIIGAIAALIGRTDVLNTIVRIVDTTPSTVPFWGGFAYWQLPTVLIPRAIWPDKPSLPIGLLVTQTYYDHGNDSSVYMATGLCGDMYMNFGYWGITFGMMVIGAIYRVLSDKVTQLMGKATFLSFMGVGIPLSFFILYEQSLYQILEQSLRLGLFCIPVLAYLLVIERDLRNKIGNRHEANSAN